MFFESSRLVAPAVCGKMSTSSDSQTMWPSVAEPPESGGSLHHFGWIR